MRKSKKVEDNEFIIDDYRDVIGNNYDYVIDYDEDELIDYDEWIYKWVIVLIYDMARHSKVNKKSRRVKSKKPKRKAKKQRKGNKIYSMNFFYYYVEYEHDFFNLYFLEISLTRNL